MQLFSWQGYKIEVKRRRFQRSLSLRVAAPGLLRVCCSHRVSLRQILHFIEDKKDFINDRRKEWDHILEKLPVRHFVEGERCLFLGELRELKFELKEGRPKVELQGPRMKVSMAEIDPKTAHEALMKFYKKTGQNYLTHLVGVQSRRMGLFPSALSFRSQRTRWGSCTSEGKVSLNWRLVAAPSQVAEYVVIHELAHLRHQDHSKKFWGLVEEFSPDYRSHTQWLRENQVQFDFLDVSFLESTNTRWGL